MLPVQVFECSMNFNTGQGILKNLNSFSAKNIEVLEAVSPISRISENI